MVVDYSKAKIYKIVCDTTGLVYIGSTCQALAVRLSGHKMSHKRFLQGKYHFVTSFKVIENGNYDMVLLQRYPCDNKEELHAKERSYIESMTCVNKVIPCRTKKEYVVDTKDIKCEYDRLRREANRESINLKKRQHYALNAERIKKIQNLKHGCKEYLSIIKLFKIQIQDVNLSTKYEDHL